MRYNRGEWSEAYAFIKLIGEGEVYASDDNLNKVNEPYYPILKVFKDEIEKFYTNDVDRGIVNIIDFNGEIVSSFDSNEFMDIANCTLESIKSSSGSSFEIPYLENFLHQIGIDTFKGSSRKKEDIKMEICDVFLNKPDILTFSVKSELGNKPTILNASKSTNFTFKIENISDDEVDFLNSIDRNVNRKWLKLKFGKLFEFFEVNKCNISLVDDNPIFYQNLRLIDSNLPSMLAYMLFYFYSHEQITDIEMLTEELINYNPLNLSRLESDLFYKKKISEFIESVTFGMMPHDRWDGKYEISGGLLTVKNDGEILCHHIFYDNVALKNYLYKNVKLETPSTSRHGFGDIYKYHDDFYFKLNLQLRFK